MAKNIEETTTTFELIAGYLDADNVLHSDFDLREIDGTDEEAISKPEVRTNGGRIIRTLIERCCTRVGTIYKSEVKSSVWLDMINNLYTGDQDYIMLKLREISLGSELTSEYKCPAEKCGAPITHIVEVDELEIVPFKGEREVSFELPRGYVDKDGEVYRTGTMRLPIGLDREVLDGVMRKNVGQANTLMLSRCMISLDGVKQIHDNMIRSLVIKDRNYLMEVLKDNVFGVELTQDITCPTCYYNFKANLNVVNFI